MNKPILSHKAGQLREDPVDIDIAAEQMLAGLRAVEEDSPAAQPVREYHGVGNAGNLRRWGVYLAVAASVLILLPVLRYLPERQATQKVNVYKTAPAQRASLQLPDGSMVVLAPASELRYPSDFGKSSRSIELTGEAVFTVSKQAPAPFIVHTHDATVRVLGTVFGIKAFYHSQSVRVIVADGKVALGNGAVLSMGDISEITANGTQITHNADVVAALSWTQGRLVFKGVPLRDAVKDLERWYGLNITISAPNLANRLITISLDNDPAEAVFAMLEQILDARAHRTGKRITISPVNSYE